MKNNKRKRLRLKPLPSAQKEVASQSTNGKGLWKLGLFACIGVLLIIGGFVFLNPSKPATPVSSVPAQTNRTSIPQTATISAEDMADALTTNRPGAVKSFETEGSADEINNTGVNLLASNNAAEAVPIFKRAIVLKPDDETFHFNLALAFMKSGDPTNAEHEYKEALRLLPDYPEVHNNYGNLLARSGRMAEAEQHLTEAVSEMPESAHYHNSLGVVQQKLKKTNEALLSFQKAIECDTNLIEAHFNLAEEYLARHDRTKGIEQLLEALRIKPDFAPAKRALANITSVP